MVAIERKRKRSVNDNEHDPATSILEGKTAKLEAQQFLLARAKMPFDALDTTSRLIRRRPLEPSHVAQLKKSFLAGVKRLDNENCLRVLCTQKEVRRVQGNQVALGLGEEVADFRKWTRYNKEKLEVMAGHHRIQALREWFSEEGHGSTDDLWWTCELYCKETLPLSLNVQLCMNRDDTNLTDSHSQIWRQLDTLASDQAKRDPAFKVNKEFLKASFSINDSSMDRLATLYNREAWRTRTSAWIETRLGFESFNISTFEYLSGTRMDKYWFEKLESTLAFLSALPFDEKQELGPKDWANLSKAETAENEKEKDITDEVTTPLKAKKRKGKKSKGAVGIAQVFYPLLDRNDKGENASGTQTRAPQFLPTLTKEQYDEVYSSIAKATHKPVFPDLVHIFQSKKTAIGIWEKTLRHVIAWIHPESIRPLDHENPKRKSKTLLQEYLSDALKALATSRKTPPAADGGAAGAIQLQRQVLDFADNNLALLQNLDRLTAPDGVEPLVESPDYGDRFEEDVWARLLTLVRQVVDSPTDGAVLRPSWHAVHSSDQSRGKNKKGGDSEGGCKGDALVEEEREENSNDDGTPTGGTSEEEGEQVSRMIRTLSATCLKQWQQSNPSVAVGEAARLLEGRIGIVLKRFLDEWAPGNGENTKSIEPRHTQGLESITAHPTRTSTTKPGRDIPEYRQEKPPIKTLDHHKPAPSPSLPDDNTTSSSWSVGSDLLRLEDEVPSDLDTHGEDEHPVSEPEAPAPTPSSKDQSPGPRKAVLPGHQAIRDVSFHVREVSQQPANPAPSRSRPAIPPLITPALSPLAADDTTFIKKGPRKKTSRQGKPIPKPPHTPRPQGTGTGGPDKSSYRNSTSPSASLPAPAGSMGAKHRPRPGPNLLPESPAPSPIRARKQDESGSTQREREEPSWMRGTPAKG